MAEEHKTRLRSCWAALREDFSHVAGSPLSGSSSAPESSFKNALAFASNALPSAAPRHYLQPFLNVPIFSRKKPRSNSSVPSVRIALVPA